ncbi:uncharacterized protein pierce2 [Heterodontus francisci]|uniref:uncharacterized protein pierce2 n=1 Tax=Heterodontus francisci TaxID=7792 RepID=UPI00355BB0A9
MSRYPTPAPARKVQFKDSTCDDDLTPSSAPKVEAKDAMYDNINLARKVHFKDSVCDNLSPTFASKSDSKDTTCDDLNSALAQKIQIEDSMCDDFNPSFAPKVESKDAVCDDLNLPLAGKVQSDELRDEFNPSFAVKPESIDTVCDEPRLFLAPEAECKDLVSDKQNQMFAPKVEHKKETSDDVPIPADAPKGEDKEKLWSPCVNPGNLIFSCMANIPTPSHSPAPFVKPQNPLYKTTSAAYGSNQPTCEIAPSVYKPLSQSFSAKLQNSGMYRNGSLNTGVDKNRVHDFLPFYGH